MESDLREFIYLDSLSVQSLLASQDVGIAQEEVETDEDTTEASLRSKLSAGISFPFIGSGKGEVDISGTRTGTEVLETRKKINDQLLFTRLYDELEDSITTLPDDRAEDTGDSLSLNNGDIVEISGITRTDPLYRMLNVASLFARIDAFGINKENIEQAREAIYGKQIGMVTDVPDDDWNYAMSVERKNLWVDDPQREFLGSRRYTVFGRVEAIVPPNDQWDYIDILQIAGTIVSKDSLNSVRTLVDEFVELIDGYQQEVPLPQLGEISIDDLSENNEPPTRNSTISIDIEDKDISVEGRAVVIKPIAVYW
jgi:hypothetical protein